MDGLPRRFSTIATAASAASLNLGAGGQVCPPDSAAVQQHPVKQVAHQIFGLWQSGSVPFVLQTTPPLTQEMAMVDAASPCPTWWTIDLWAREITRRILPNGDDSLPALPLSTIMANGLRFSRLKARIHFENVLQNSIDVDIGTGICLSLLANSVRVSLLLPESFRLGTQVGQNLGPGNLVDSMAAASIYQSESPIGEKSATFTQYVTRVGTVVRTDDILVPPGAKFVTIYESPAAGNHNLLWIQHGATSTVPCGEIVFPASQLVEKIAVPQNADTLRIPSAAENEDRGWNIIWHLRF